MIVFAQVLEKQLGRPVMSDKHEQPQMERPLPAVDDVSRTFWEACAREELVMQRCSACATWSYPAKLACGVCQSTDLAFEKVSGRGTLYSFTVQRQAFHAGFLPYIPNTVAMVQLDESPELLVVANLVGVDEQDPVMGLPVVTHFDHRDGITVPVFSPA